MPGRTRPLALVLLLSACAGPAAARRGPGAPDPAEVDRAAHALDRLGFGAGPGQAEEVARSGVERWIRAQLHPERIDESALDRRLAAYSTLETAPEDLAERFPSGPVLQAVARGELPIPADPREQAIYETRLAARLERAMQGGAPAPGQAAGAQDARPDPALVESLLALPAEARLPRLLSLAPGERIRLLRSLPLPQRLQLAEGVAPAEQEVMEALVDPARVPAGELADAKVLRAVLARRQLLEVMTDLWENHFNVFVHKGAIPWLLGAHEREAIRPHALGRFRDLLGATARSPAMLFYLDNWASVGPRSRRGLRSGGKEGLNENYARELLELHTLGATAGYTQGDVEEVARCFTGWTLERPFRGGGFAFDPRRHEPGDKVVLGHLIREGGEREGEEVLDLLARDPHTARRVASELAVRFVSDDPPPALVDRLARRFQETGGDLRAVLETLFRAPEFWAPSARRAKLKTPLELVASAVRASGAEVEQPASLVEALRRMGMEPYAMPTPNGWSWRAEAWSGAGALAERVGFALRLARGQLPGVHLDAVALAGGAADPEAVQARVTSALLHGMAGEATRLAVSARLAAAGSPEERGAAAVGLLLASPEFQRR